MASDRSGQIRHILTSYSSYVPRKGDTGVDTRWSSESQDEAQLRPDREAAPPVATAPRYTGPDGRLYRAPMTFKCEGRRHRVAVGPAGRDRDGGLGARRRGPRRDAPRRPRRSRAYADAVARDAQDQRPRAAPDHALPLPDAPRHLHQPDLRRQAHRPDHGRGRQRLVRRSGARPRDGARPGLQPAAHDLDHGRDDAAAPADPVQPGPHPRRRQHPAGPQGPPRLARGARDHRRRSCPTATS